MIKKLLIRIAIPLLFFILIFSNWQIISNLNSLRNITIRNITIEGKNYTLDNGKVYEKDKKLSWFIPSQREKASKVLSLVGFYMWNKEDPLLTSPDLNTKDFESSIQLLEKQSRDFQKDMNLKYDIFPIQFLYSVIKVKNATDIFLNKPTLDNAAKLTDIQRQTIKNYREDLQQRIALIEPTLNAQNINKNILYMQLATTPEIIINDYKMLLSNAEKIEKEIELREGCLNGNAKCNRPLYNLSSVSQIKKNASIPAILKENTLFDDYLSTNMAKTGPFLVQTPCLGLNVNLGEQKHAYYIYRGVDNSPQLGNRESIYAVNATDIYFRRVEDIITKDAIYHDKGIYEWAPISSTQTYGCPDLTYLAKINTMNSYILKLENHPLFNNMQLTGNDNTDKIIKEGQKLEKTLINAEIKDYDDFYQLGNLYLKFYHEIYSNGKLSNFQKKADTFLNYGLGMERLLADFPLIFTRTVQEFISLSIYQRLDNIDSSNIHLYGIRNIPDFSYITFSKSFFRLDKEQENYQRKIVDNIGFDNRYLTYTLATTRYSKDEIKSWFQNVLSEIYERYVDYKNKE